ncbi:hypothetical protein ACE6H2_019107 [Prunus campanulata]
MQQTDTKKAPSIAPNPCEHTYDKIYGFPKALPYQVLVHCFPNHFSKQCRLLAVKETSMESVKKFLEKEGEMAMTMDGLPDKFFESFIMKGIKVDLLEPGRIVCSFKVSPRLLK